MEFAVWVPIIVALIAGPVMWMLRRFEQRNDQQHAENGKVLASIKDAVMENRDDIRDVKADLRDVKADHRRLAVELDRHVRGDVDV